MKFVVLALVLVAVLAWIALGRRRDAPPARGSARRRADSAAAPEAMVACAHCGVHLPQPDALRDAGGRPYCSDAHRLAGPR